MNKLPTQNQLDKIKIIVFDLDGTLLDHNKHISKNTCALLISLQQKGYILAIASGRFYYEVKPYIEQLQINKFGGYVLCANGLEVYDLFDNTQYHFTKLTHEEVIKIMKTAKQKKINCYLNYHNQYYVALHTPYKICFQLAKVVLFPFKKLFSKYRLIFGLYKLGMVEQIQDEISELHKICFLAPHKRLKQLEEEIMSWNQHFIFYFVNEYITEITHSSVGKYEAIKYICKKRKETMETIMAFGDSGNDLNLIKHAGIGVAMKNGFPEIKEVTSFQTLKSNQEEGIYDFLKQLDMKKRH